MSHWVIYITNNTIALVAQKEMISINYLAEKGALKEYYEQTIINNHINHLVFK